MRGQGAERTTSSVTDSFHHRIIPWKGSDTEPIVQIQKPRLQHHTRKTQWPLAQRPMEEHAPDVGVPDQRNQTHTRRTSSKAVVRSKHRKSNQPVGAKEAASTRTPTPATSLTRPLPGKAHDAPKDHDAAAEDAPTHYPPLPHNLTFIEGVEPRPHAGGQRDATHRENCTRSAIRGAN